MQPFEHYAQYVTLCEAHGTQPLTYTAWCNLFPLPMDYL